MNDYHHGVRVIEVDNGSRPIRTIQTAVIGVVCSSNDADPNKFKLNRPALLTDVSAAVEAAGDTGTLAPALDAIKDHGNPLTLVVRIPEADTIEEQTSLTIGGMEGGQYTGLQALKMSNTIHGVKPRILGAPGLDTQPVAVELAAMAKQSRSFCYTAAWGCETISDVVDYRQNFGSKEQMIIWPNFISWDNKKNAATATAATARALGLRAFIDDKIGFHKTLSNVEVQGVMGIDKDVSWSLEEKNTDAQFLNKNDITTLIREEGYRFWGNRTCSADPKWAFENYTRTAQIIADTMAAAKFYFVDTTLHPTLARGAVEDINKKLRDMATGGYILGGEAWFDERKNPKEALSQGRVVISYDFDPVPPAENIILEQHRGDYKDDFVFKIQQTI